ncbi:MAG: MBL fold metallo-hydrolase [Tissierellia bacterium]|nr:MBL fold metallo-hydrolase [Tissierellia bacterium]
MKMKFCSLSSGSSGNCQYIETENSKILVDAGMSGKKIEELLKSIDVEAKDLDAIFVTHEHNDHCAGVGVLSRRYDLPVFANKDTWEAMLPTIKEVKESNIKVFDIEKDFEFRDLHIVPVPLFHDAVNANGFVLENEKSKVSIVTDTGWVSSDMKELILNSNLYFIESNHDEDMLKNGHYSWVLKQRILSTRGHLSNFHTATLLGEILKANRERIILSHLSSDNNTPTLAYETVYEYLDQKGYDIEREDVLLSVAPRYSATELIEL